MAIETADGEALRSRMALEKTANGTRVRWGVETDFGMNLPARYGGLWFESGTGEMLDRGIAELRTLAESLPRADWSETEIERLDVEPLDIAYLTASSLPNAAAISEAMGEAYFSILAFMDRHGLDEAGPPLSISRRFSGSELVFDAAIPVRGISDDTPQREAGIRLGQTWGGPVVRGRHIGSYRRLAETHEKIAAWLAVHGVARAGDAWEAYVSDPSRTPEAELVTEIYYPIEAL
jgi:effector-binding domain-containing protein